MRDEHIAERTDGRIADKTRSAAQRSGEETARFVMTAPPQARFTKIQIKKRRNSAKKKPDPNQTKKKTDQKSNGERKQ